jgi:outer membrane protein assembly factor BamB
MTANAENMDRYRGVNNSGYYSAMGLMRSWPEGGPKLAWKVSPGLAWSNVAVVDDNVYVVGGVTASLFVYDLNGNLLRSGRAGPTSWKRFSGSRTTPLVHDGIAAVGMPNANYVAIDLKTMERRWELNAWKSFGAGSTGQGWGWPESPMRHGDKLIFNACSRDPKTPSIVAVNIRDGEKVWAVPGRPAGASSPSGKPDRYSGTDLSGAVFRHNGRDIVAYPTFVYLSGIDAETGKVLWELSSEGSKSHTPIYADGRLLWGPANNFQMLELNPDGSAVKTLWNRKGWTAWSGGVMFGGRVYALGNSGAEPEGGQVAVAAVGGDDVTEAAVKTAAAKGGVALLCLDAATGKLIASLPHSGMGVVVAAEGMIYVTEMTGKSMDVRLIRPTSNGMEDAGRLTVPPPKEKADREQSWICPVVAEGRLFVRYGDLYVYEIGVEDPWVGWRFNGNGITDVARPPLPWSKLLNQRWTADVGKESQTVTMAGQHVLVGGTNRLACLDAASGKQIWVHEEKGGSISVASTPVVQGGTVFMAFGNGSVIRFNLADGAVQWQAKAPMKGRVPMAPQPVISEQVVVAHGSDLVGLNAADGKVLWTVPQKNPQAGISAKLRLDGVSYLVTGSGTLIRPSDGAVVLDGLPRADEAQVVVDGDMAYICSKVITAVKFSVADGKPVAKKLWDVTTGSTEAVVVHEGRLFQPHESELVAFDAFTGKLLGRQSLSGSSRTGPMTLASGNLWLPGPTTTVFRANPSMDKLWEFAAAKGAALGFHADTVAVLTGGNLIAFGGQTPSAPPPLATAEIAASSQAPLPKGLPTTPFVNDICPSQWLWAAPVPGFDIETDFLASLGGREKAVPGLDATFKVGDKEFSFQPLTTNHIWQSKFSGNVPVMDLTAVHGRKYHTTGYYVTAIENDQDRWVQFKTLLDNASHWRARFDYKAWLSGKPVNEETLYRLSKGTHVLLIQAGIGECEEWGKIFMYPRLLDVTELAEKRLTQHRADMALWERYQAEEVGKPFSVP